ncbi:MAG: hypothetical protein IJ688_07200 [Treponema sp.]|nr:hypothetical protein [Treponema sp.]
MKKLACILFASIFLGISAFCDVIIMKDLDILPVMGTSEYDTYNKRIWNPDFKDFDMSAGTSVLFSLPSLGNLNFYLGAGSSVNMMYSLPGISVNVNSAISYSFHESSWPQMEIFLYTRAGCGFTFIKGVDFYMFADAMPYFMFMPPKGHHGFFFGAGPQIEYLQAANWELYNKIDFGFSLAGGFRFQTK